MVYRTNYAHPEFGEVTLASDGEGIVGLWMAGQKYFGGTVNGEMAPNDDLRYSRRRRIGSIGTSLASSLRSRSCP